MADAILLDLKSRYRNTLVHRFSGTNKPYFDLWDPPKIKETKAPTIIRVTAKYIKRPDLVAHDVYGDVSLYWVIAIRNNIMLPMKDLIVGSVLICPAIEDVMAGLQSSK